MTEIDVLAVIMGLAALTLLYRLVHNTRRREKDNEVARRIHRACLDHRAFLKRVREEVDQDREQS